VVTTVAIITSHVIELVRRSGLLEMVVRNIQEGRADAASTMSMLLDQRVLQRPIRKLTAADPKLKPCSTQFQKIETYEVGKSEDKSGE